MSFVEYAFGASLKLVNIVLDHPAAADALQRTGELRDAALAVQEAVLGMLNLPTASDVSRLDARLRSTSQRLEGIEDALEHLSGQVGVLPAALRGIEAHLAAVAERAGTSMERTW